MIDLMSRSWTAGADRRRAAALGTINHTLLTLEALGRRAVPIAGVVMVGRPESSENRARHRALRPRRGPRRAAAARSADAGTASRLGGNVARSGRPPDGVSGMSRATLIDRDRACVWHPIRRCRRRRRRLPIVRGEGVYLYTEDGRRLLDGISSWWVNIHGHSHPAAERRARRPGAAARARDVRRLHASAGRRAGRAAAGGAAAGLTRVFYSDNGSTAVEVALKLACQYWGNRGQPSRRSFVALHHAYHGDTVGAMSASEDSIFTRPFASMLFAVHRAHAPYCYRCPLGLERATCAIECLRRSRTAAHRARRRRSPACSSSRCCRAPAG